MKMIELKSMEELAYLASVSPFGTPILHFKDKAENNYYYLMGGTMHESWVYYVKAEEIKKRFINLDTTKNKVEYTDSPILDPKIKVIPIIEVKAQNLIDF
ncbi:MAG: hypothetical protein QXX08_02315 [Candidatus Bathyarchaeia archaeon]